MPQSRFFGSLLGGVDFLDRERNGAEAQSIEDRSDRPSVGNDSQEILQGPIAGPRDQDRALLRLPAR